MPSLPFSGLLSFTSTLFCLCSTSSLLHAGANRIPDPWAGENTTIRNSEFPQWNFLWLISIHCARNEENLSSRFQFGSLTQNIEVPHLHPKLDRKAAVAGPEDGTQVAHLLYLVKVSLTWPMWPMWPIGPMAARRAQNAFNPVQSCSILFNPVQSFFNPFQSVSIRFNLQSHRHRHCLAHCCHCHCTAPGAPALHDAGSTKLTIASLAHGMYTLAARGAPPSLSQGTAQQGSANSKKESISTSALSDSLSLQSLQEWKVSATHEVIHWSLVAWVSELGEVLGGLCAS